MHYYLRLGVIVGLQKVKKVIVPANTINQDLFTNLQNKSDPETSLKERFRLKQTFLQG